MKKVPLGELNKEPISELVSEIHTFAKEQEQEKIIAKSLNNAIIHFAEKENIHLKGVPKKAPKWKILRKQKIEDIFEEPCLYLSRVFRRAVRIIRYGGTSDKVIFTLENGV